MTQRLWRSTRAERTVIQRHRATIYRSKHILVRFSLELDRHIRIVRSAFKPPAIAKWEILARHRPQREQNERRRTRARVARRNNVEEVTLKVERTTVRRSLHRMVRL